MGQTKLGLSQRFRAHIHAMSNPARTQPITNAMRKYGIENFTIEELERCASAADLDEAEKRWAHALETFAPAGYNLRAGNGPRSVSPETRAAMRAAMTPERKEHLRAVFKGRRLPDHAYVLGRAAVIVTLRLIGPDGQWHTIEDVPEFCRSEGLDLSLIFGVSRGSRQEHKGWRLVPPLAVIATAVPGAGSRDFSCPCCGRVWVSPSQARANQHVRSCVALTAATEVAFGLGQIAPGAYRRQLDRRAVPLVQVRNRRKGQFSLTSAAVLLDPTGRQWDVTNQAEFAVEQGLGKSRLNLLITGKTASYRGWTLISRDVAA